MTADIFLFTKKIRNWLFKFEPVSESLAVRDAVPRSLFFVTIIFYCLYLLILQSDWVLSGAMWAEMATDYFFKSNLPSIVVKLFSADNAGYIPLPQRLLAAVGQSFSLPASTIPYFYTWSAIVLTGGMAAAFCLKPFRVLVRNDYLRFLTALVILLIADFETRTFINFTYFGAFFAAIIAALALVEEKNEVPWWSWFIPIFMVSKPAVLAVLPAMLIAALVSKSRFRKITLLVTLLCLVQVARMAFSHSSGQFVSTNEFTFFEKLYAAITYCVGFLGAFFAGKAVSFASEAVSVEFYRPILIGLGVLVFCLAVLFKKRNNSSALILVGLSVLFSNVFINSFALSDSWNLDMGQLARVPLYRHIIVGFFGVVLIVVGLVNAFFAESNGRAKFIKMNAPSWFLIWFFCSGWCLASRSINRVPASPLINNSQWQQMAYAIDSGGTVCVPIDPFGWIFGRNCFQLNSDVSWWDKKLTYKNFSTDENLYSVSVAPPSSVLNKNLISISVLAKPRSQSSIHIDAQAVIEMRDGTTRDLYGNRKLPVSGGLLMLSTNHAIPTNDIRRLILKFSIPVDVGYMTSELGDNLAMLWLGN